jgi:iron-sulfur cluster insertion protein
MSETISQVGGSEVASERGVVITDNAARRIAALKQQEEAGGAFLRIAVSGGGCSGFQYGLSFDDQRNPDDFVFARGGVAVIVDDVSLDLLNGAEVDFVEDLMGASFQIKNPNAASSCGCGNSFSVAL